MAPAANERAYGSNGGTVKTKYAPMTPAIGSTIPDNCPLHITSQIHIIVSQIWDMEL